MSISRTGNPVSPALVEQLFQLDQWHDVPLNSDWVEALVGTGSTSLAFGPRRMLLSTGATIASSAARKLGGENSWSRGQGSDVIDWDKRISIQATLVSEATVATALSRLTMGKAAGDGVGDIADKGVGIRLDDFALFGLVHDGVGLTAVDLSTLLADLQVERVTIKSDGLGNVQWFVNGVLVGSTTGGPTGLGTPGSDLMQAEVENPGTAAAKSFRLHNLKVFVGQ